VLTAVAAVRSFIAYVVILAYIAVAAPLALVLGVGLRWKTGMWILGHFGAKLALALAGIRYRVIGRENVPATAVVFCSNHESNVDPPVLFEALHRRLHILYKAELHKFPIMGTVFDVGGFIPIERNDRESAMQSIARGSESLRAGNSFLIFPEGTRSCRSRRAGSSWQLAHRLQSFPSPSAVAAPPCGRGVPSSGPCM
jgi:1-acyl-sn-glycerol-3-phosphate acyltransferase